MFRKKNTTLISFMFDMEEAKSEFLAMTSPSSFFISEFQVSSLYTVTYVSRLDTLVLFDYCFCNLDWEWTSKRVYELDFNSKVGGSIDPYNSKPYAWVGPWKCANT